MILFRRLGVVRLSDAVFPIEEHKNLQRIKTRFRDEKEELKNKFRDNHEKLIDACLSDTEDDQDKEAYQWMLDNPGSSSSYDE